LEAVTTGGLYKVPVPVP